MIFRILFIILIANSAIDIAKATGFDPEEPFLAPFQKIMTKSKFIYGGRDYKLHPGIDPKKSVVIVYTHGAGPDEEKDECRFRPYYPLFDQGNGNTFVPRVFRTLRIGNQRVSIFYICHQEVGDESPLPRGRSLEEHRKTPCLKAGSRAPNENGNQSKLCKRARRIWYEVSQIRKHNPGLGPSRIFLSGGSAGGWASLLLKAHRPKVAAGVIAFAPAAHGDVSANLGRLLNTAQRAKVLRSVKCLKKKTHGPLAPLGRWSASFLRHKCQMEFISERVSGALVFAYARDNFNNPEVLAEFGKLGDRVRFHPVGANSLRKICGWKLPWAGKDFFHSCHQGSGFAWQYRQTIERFIGYQLAISN